jgi:hypothetical protein
MAAVKSLCTRGNVLENGKVVLKELRRVLRIFESIILSPPRKIYNNNEAFK